MSKIICRLKGGLGNQLFIYAACYGISKSLNADFLIDGRSGFWFDRYKRHFVLGEYRISQTQTSFILSFFIKFYEKTAIQKKNRLFKNYAFLVTEQITLPQLSTLYKEYKHSIFIIDDNFQNESFFAAWKQNLKAILRPNSIPDFVLNTFSNHIKDNKLIPVCLHGRLLRAYSSAGNKVHTEDPRVVPYTYYDNAIDYIIKNIENPYFYIFSDSPEELIQNINLQGKPFTLVQHPHSTDPQVDLFLMSECVHFIISNSSYSWWGAWLAEKDNSIITSPPRKYWDNSATVPERWVILNP